MVGKTEDYKVQFSEALVAHGNFGTTLTKSRPCIHYAYIRSSPKRSADSGSPTYADDDVGRVIACILVQQSGV